jgi:hypothetical protein
VPFVSQGNKKVWAERVSVVRDGGRLQCCPTLPPARPPVHFVHGDDEGSLAHLQQVDALNGLPAGQGDEAAEIIGQSGTGVLLPAKTGVLLPAKTGVLLPAKQSNTASTPTQHSPPQPLTPHSSIIHLFIWQPQPTHLLFQSVHEIHHQHSNVAQAAAS